MKPYHLTFRLHSIERTPEWSAEYTVMVDGRVNHIDPEKIICDFAAATMLKFQDAHTIDRVEWRYGQANELDEWGSLANDILAITGDGSKAEWFEVDTKNFNLDYIIVSRGLFARAALTLVLAHRFIENWAGNLPDQNKQELLQLVHHLAENPQQEINVLGMIREESNEVGQAMMQELYPNESDE